MSEHVTIEGSVFTEVLPTDLSVGGGSLHLMLDLETFSTRPNSAIREIGWAAFRMDDVPGRMKASGSIFVDPQEQLDSEKFHKDWSTISWWMLRSQEVRERFADLGAGIDLSEALKIFQTGVMEARSWEGIWSHGASFDVPILQNAYGFLGMDVPWSYRSVRDTRTIFDLAKPLTVDNPMLHSARHDAIAQATEIQAAVRYIRGKLDQ